MLTFKTWLLTAGTVLCGIVLSAGAREDVPQTSSPQTGTPVPRGRFGGSPGKAPESKDNLRPKDDLQLIVDRPDQIGSDEVFRYPWIQLTIHNIGKQPWFFSRSAGFAGMEINVSDSRGNKVPLNERGIKLAQNVLTSLPRRNADLLPGGKETFRIALGDSMELPKSQKYRVQIRWTVNMHPSNELRRNVEPNRDPGLSPTLESNIYEIDFRGQQK